MKKTERISGTDGTSPVECLAIQTSKTSLHINWISAGYPPDIWTILSTTSLLNVRGLFFSTMGRTPKVLNPLAHAGT